MIRFIKKIANKIIKENHLISTNGANPNELNNTQQMFLRWNAKRSNISLQESKERYFASWSAIRGGHRGLEYRAFNDLCYSLFQVFFGDSQEEIYTSYSFFAPMHFLRMLSYPEPKWTEDDPIIHHLVKSYSDVNILDYGCGLVQKSRSLAEYLKQKGIKPKLTFVDIPTIRKDFVIAQPGKKDMISGSSAL